MEMCAWFSNCLDNNARFTEDCVLFSAEANFYVNEEVNKQNMRYWSQDNLHWISPYQTTRSGEDYGVVWPVASTCLGTVFL